jgi:Cdc6-like AAA superfamily ATPase
MSSGPDSAVGKGARLARVGQVFSPGAPVDKYALFAGRRQQVADVINAVNMRSQHVVLYGERGVGKTSLANVLGEIFADQGVGGLNSGTVNCDRRDTFSTIWHKVFREINVWDDDGGDATLNQWLKEDVSPEDVRYLLDAATSDTIVILDEVDLIQDRETKSLLADTIKTLADHSTRTTLVLVGVADSVDELIEYHQSLERSLIQVRMPRMSREELLEIIDNGAKRLDMEIDKGARTTIAQRSEGLPHFTHLLSLHAFQRAVFDDRSKVTSADVNAATKVAVEKTQQSIMSDYHKATISQQPDTLYEKVLLACALAKTDALGFFAAKDIRDPLSRIAGKRYEIPAFSRHLKELSAPKRGPILQQTGTERRYRFRFVNPMMQPFIIMHGLAEGMIKDRDLTN